MRAFLSVLALVFAFGATPAAAQSAERRARDLFQQGIAAARAERWDEARDLFEASYAADPRPSTLVNLAGAYAKTNRFVEAIRGYEAFLELQLPSNLERIRPSVQSALDETRGRVAQVTLNIRGGAFGDRVLLDDEEVATNELSRPRPLNPGEHRARIERNGSVVAERAFSAHESEQLSVDLLVAQASGAGASANTEQPSEPQPPARRSSSSWRTPVGWTAIGVGAAGLVAGVALHVVRENTVSDNPYVNECPNPVAADRLEYCQGLRADAESKVDAYTAGAIAGYVVGGALVATGVVLLLLPRPRESDDAQAATVSCVPMIGSTLGGACAGTF